MTPTTRLRAEGLSLCGSALSPVAVALWGGEFGTGRALRKPRKGVRVARAKPMPPRARPQWNSVTRGTPLSAPRGFDLRRDSDRKTHTPGPPFQVPTPGDRAVASPGGARGGEPCRNGTERALQTITRKDGATHLSRRRCSTWRRRSGSPRSGTGNRLALSRVLMLLFRRCRVCARVRWHPAPGTTAPGTTAHWHHKVDLSSGGQSFRLVLRRTSLKSPRGNMYLANFQPEEPS